MRRIRADLWRLSNFISRERRTKELLQVVALSSLAGIAFGSMAGNAMLMVLFSFVCGGLGLFGLAWVHSSRRVRARSLQLRAAVGGNTQARVMHVRATAYARFDEHEDLGALYVFQTGTNELFVLRGHRYDETGAFPCLQFDLVEVPGALLVVRPRSPKVLPAMEYGEEDTAQVGNHITDRSTVAGTLGNAVQALRRPTQPHKVAAA